MRSQSKLIIRILLYTSLTVSIFWVAHLNSIHLKQATKEQSIQVIKREVKLLWELTKVEVDLLNEEAQSIIDRLGLKPGQPLPPKTFWKEKDSTRKNFISSNPVEITKIFPISSGQYSTKIVTMISVDNKVPKEGEKYAYAGIEHNYEIFGQNFTIYPTDNFAVNRLKEALKRVSKEKLNTNVPKIDD